MTMMCKCVYVSAGQAVTQQGVWEYVWVLWVHGIVICVCS